MKLSERLYVEQAGRCFYCKRMCWPTDGRKMTDKEQREDLFTVDHLLPKVYGGKKTWMNTVGACRMCNVLRGSKNHGKYMNRIKDKRMNEKILKLFPEFDLWWPKLWKRFLDDVDKIITL